MSIKAKFLQMPLKAQIFTSLIIMTFVVVILILSLSGGFTMNHQQYMLARKREYFLNMKLQIMETNIFLVNLCLLQYENLIKVFNYRFYQFLKTQTDFATELNRSDIINKIILYDPLTDPAHNPSIDSDLIFIYCFSKNKQQVLETVLHSDLI